MHIAPDLTDHLPSCKPRVQQERAGVCEEDKGRIRSLLTDRSLLTRILPISQRNSKTFSVSHQAKLAEVRRTLRAITYVYLEFTLEDALNATKLENENIC